MFSGPADMTFNRGRIDDPSEFAREAGAASWLYLCGEEFAAMEGGMSYADVAVEPLKEWVVQGLLELPRRA